MKFVAIDQLPEAQAEVIAATKALIWHALAGTGRTIFCKPLARGLPPDFYSVDDMVVPIWVGVFSSQSKKRNEFGVYEVRAEVRVGEPSDVTGVRVLRERVVGGLDMAKVLQAVADCMRSRQVWAERKRERQHALARHELARDGWTRQLNEAGLPAMAEALGGKAFAEVSGVRLEISGLTIGEAALMLAALAVDRSERKAG